MNFTLRPWTINDLESLVEYANNIQIAKYMTNQFPHPYTTEKGKAFIEYTSKSSPSTIFAIDINGKAVGGIGIHPQTDIHCKNAELGYWLAEPFWGDGIITKAVAQMVDYGFNNFDIDRIFARPFGTNKGSQKVLEKAGFILEAKIEKILFKNNEYLDELIYGIRRRNKKRSI
jgi:[ribosomal protein S5]-alanine N-acetyltransferase